jgi:hypothetical protein
MQILPTRPSYQVRYWGAALAVLAALGWSGWSSGPGQGPDDAKRTATAFLDNLAAGRLGSALTRTSMELQSHGSAEQLLARLQPPPGPDEAVSVREWVDGAGARRCQVQMQRGEARIAVNLLTEGGEWKISSCVVQRHRTDGAPLDAPSRHGGR